MQQYFAKNKNLDLEDGDYHHIKNVMKMKCGDLIKVVYDKVICTCKLNNISNKSTFDVIKKEYCQYSQKAYNSPSSCRFNWQHKQNDSLNCNNY